MSQSYSVCIVNTSEDNKQFIVQVKDSMRVRELRQIVASRMNLQPVNIRLSHSDLRMEDAKTLATYGLQDSSKIYLVIYHEGAITVTVNGTSGAATFEKVFAGDTAATFLQRYQKKQGPNKNFKLIHRGVEIDASTPLSELDIGEGEMFQVTAYVKGG